MNTLPETQQGSIHQQSSSTNPKHQNFDFDLWAKAVRKQMLSVFDKKISLIDHETDSVL